jgi:hypothetical protein
MLASIAGCAVAPLQANGDAGTVLSKIDEVLNGSNSPRDADKAVFAKSDRTRGSFIGWNVHAASTEILG